MVQSGKGGKYSKKYVRIDVDTLKKEIIPLASDICARERAEKGLDRNGYLACLKREIKRLIDERSK